MAEKVTKNAITNQYNTYQWHLQIGLNGFNHRVNELRDDLF